MVVVEYPVEFQNMKGEMAFPMNDAVGWELPRHLCIESRMFSTMEAEIKSVKPKAAPLVNDVIPDGYLLAKDQCEDYGLSYKAFCRARERGRIKYIKLPCGYCTTEQDILDYMKSRCRTGRPKKGRTA